MPELPEVETTLKGIEPYVYQRAITDIVVRESRMRWPVPTAELKALIGHTVTHIERRAKIYSHAHRCWGNSLAFGYVWKLEGAKKWS